MHISQLFVVEALCIRKRNKTISPLRIGSNRFAFAIFLSLSISFLFILNFTYAEDFPKELCDKDPDGLTLSIQNSIQNSISDEKKDHDDNCPLDPNTFKKINQINETTTRGHLSLCPLSLTSIDESNVNSDNIKENIDNEDKAAFLINMLLWRANITQEIKKTNLNETIQSALSVCEKTSENLYKKINKVPPPLTQLSSSDIQNSSTASSINSISTEDTKESKSDKLNDENKLIINAAIQMAEQFFIIQNSSLIKKNKPNRNSDTSSAAYFMSTINSSRDGLSPNKKPQLKRSSLTQTSSTTFTFNTDEDVKFLFPRDLLTQYLVRILISDPNIKYKNYNDQRTILYNKINNYFETIPNEITTICSSPKIAKHYIDNNKKLFDKFKSCNNTQNKQLNSVGPTTPKLARSSLSSTPTQHKSFSYKNSTTPVTPKPLTNLQLHRPTSISVDSSLPSSPSITPPLSARGNSQKKSSFSFNSLPLTPRPPSRLSTSKPSDIPKSRTELAEEDLNNIFERSFIHELNKLFKYYVPEINKRDSHQKQFKGRLISFDNKARYQFVRDLNQLFFANNTFLTYDLVKDEKSDKTIGIEVKTIYPKELATKLIQEIDNTNCNKSDCYEPLEKLRHYTARMAYMYNIQNTLRTIATDKKRPLGIRIPSNDSQALQQMGYATKVLKIKSKSSLISLVKRKSTIPGLGGFIPMNGNLGKYGTALKSFLKECNAENKSSHCEDRKKELEKKIEEDTAITKDLLALKDDTDSPLYTQVPRTRKRYDFLQGNFVMEIAVLEDADPKSDHLKKIEWKKYDPDHLPENTAYILADRSSNPITADTDPLLMPTEKNDPDVKYSPIYGNHTKSDLEFISQINEKWRKLTDNSNDIIQHSHEFHFGLNPFDGQVLLVNSKGEIKIFHIPDPNTKERVAAFFDIATFIKDDVKQSDGSYTVRIPTTEELRKNYEHLNSDDPTPFSEKFAQTIVDYENMRKAFYDTHSDRPKSPTKHDNFKYDETKVHDTSH